MVRETGVQFQVESYQKLKKWYLMPPCLTHSIIKARIKAKVKQSREWSTTFSLQIGVVAIKKVAFRSPSTKVTNFTYIYIYIYNSFISVDITAFIRRAVTSSDRAHFF